MGRIMAIDYGKKRVGVAVTDPLRIIASPLETVPAAAIEKFLSEYLSKEKVDELVVGYPRKLNNEPSESVKYIDPFIARLRKLFPGIPVNLADERFTTSIAKRALIEGGLKRSDRMDKSIADKVSASLILQSYIEKMNFMNKKK
ncbi:MAG: Holliday junction resolvase RuvX [Bacteroidales bacterium]|jgi:putative Holliday junction resolvase|nr:Holliday junction resolvase RuvX [Bacteroidales bacterium]MCU0408099.1 Holliday junction resolvase RuvX [Bacteroidales bacterium]